MTNKHIDGNQKRTWKQMSFKEKCWAILCAFEEPVEQTLEHRVYALERNVQALRAESTRSGGAS